MNKRLRASFEIVVAVLFFLILILMLAPLAAGFMLRHQIEAFASNHHLLGFKVEISQYEQKWFRSNLRINLTGNNSGLSLQLKNTVIHGPLYFGALRDGKSPLLKGFFISELLLTTVKGGQYQQIAKLRTAATFNNQLNGSIESLNSVPVFFSEHTISVSVDNGMGSFEYHPEKSIIHIDLKIDNVNLTNSGTQTQLNQLSLTADYQFNTQVNHWLGQSVIRLANLDSSSQDSLENILPVKKLADLDFKLLSESNDGKLNHILSSHFSDARIADIDVQNVALEVKLKNIAEILPFRIISAITNNPQGWPSLLSETLYALSQWLNTGEVELSQFHAELSAGNIDLWLRMSMPEIEPIVIMDPIFLLMALNLNAELSVNKTLLAALYEQAAPAMYFKEYPVLARSLPDHEFKQKAKTYAMEKLDILVTQKYLVAVGDNYESKLTVHQGDFRVNELSINPMQILFFQGKEAIKIKPALSK